MSNEVFRSEELAMEEARRMEDVTGFNFDVLNNGDGWIVCQIEGGLL